MVSALSPQRFGEHQLAQDKLKAISLRNGEDPAVYVTTPESIVLVFLRHLISCLQTMNSINMLR